ncbi:hypothetical protein B0H11DRAFT_1357632 [Mycena galericulata]|nr:hypothetical protein B0H11DRAFT_1357632 [Mycena galericulata]
MSRMVPHAASCQRPSHRRRRVQMDHPYSGAASYIYASEHPDAPADPKSKDPHSKPPSFIPSPSSITSTPIPSPTSKPRTSHDSSWSTEGTYTRTQRPRHADPPPARPRGLSQPRPLIPLRAPVSHPYQQRKNSRIDVDGADPDPDAEPPSAAPLILPPVLPPSLKMTPYERDGDPLSLRRSAFVPYEPRPFERSLDAERALRAKKAPWGSRIQRRIRYTVRRLTCGVVHGNLMTN